MNHPIENFVLYYDTMDLTAKTKSQDLRKILKLIKTNDKDQLKKLLKKDCIERIDASIKQTNETHVHIFIKWETLYAKLIKWADV